MTSQEHNPDKGPSLTATPTKTAGIDWNGPAGFWIGLIVLVATFVVVGLFLA